MLYPKENKAENTLMFACRTCPWAEPATSSCVFRNELTNTVGETAGITQDVGSDPTVGDVEIPTRRSVDSGYQGSEEMDQSMDVEDDFMPLCTMCGQEIVCEYCGTACGGLALEVEDQVMTVEVSSGQQEAKA